MTDLEASFLMAAGIIGWTAFFFIVLVPLLEKRDSKIHFDEEEEDR